MSDASAIEIATRRLSLALDALEAAVERRREVDRGEESLTAQLHELGNDRARLASDLDQSAARARKLETTNREIARRLDIAMDTIRSVIEAHDQ
jgi:septal ring factor EnvC (AmiA/AmiB activator)